MSELLKPGYDAFLFAYQRFHENYEKMTKESVEYKPNGIIGTKPPMNETTFTSLCEVIHWGVVLYARLSSNQLKSEDKLFLSGIKHIDNLIKHDKRAFVMLDNANKISCSPVPVSENRFSVDFKITIACFWSDISKIPCEKGWEPQRDNYNKFLKDKEVLDSINKFKLIIEGCL